MGCKGLLGMRKNTLMDHQGVKDYDEDKEIPCDQECPENRINTANHQADGKKVKSTVGAGAGPAAT